MSDLSRAALADLKFEILGTVGDDRPESVPISYSAATFLALLDMAERAVSVQTLALLNSGNVESPESDYERWKVDLVCAVATDLILAPQDAIDARHKLSREGGGNG